MVIFYQYVAEMLLKQCEVISQADFIEFLAIDNGDDLETVSVQPFTLSLITARAWAASKSISTLISYMLHLVYFVI